MQPKDSTYQQCMTCGDSALKRATPHSTAKKSNSTTMHAHLTNSSVLVIDLTHFFSSS